MPKSNLKYTVEVTTEGVKKRFEFKGQVFEEIWVRGKEGESCHAKTTGKGIDLQVEDAGLDEQLGHNIMDFFCSGDDPQELWDAFEDYEEDNN
jgi:hypothetical protein